MDLLTLHKGEPEAPRAGDDAGDDEIEHGPAERQPTGLSREPADDLRASPVTVTAIANTLGIRLTPDPATTPLR